MAELWKGAPVAAALSEELIRRVDALKAAGVTPTLAILRVGQREDDLSYEAGAVKRCNQIGIAVRRFLLSADCSCQDVLNTVRQINEDDTIHGCLIFRPLPDKAIERAACEALLPEKDVDCITAGSLAGVFSGSGAGYPPCTAQACMEILDYYGCDLTGKRVVVIGRSLVIGKPVSMMLQAKNATVTMCHTKTRDMPAVCREAEVLISAAGKAGIVDDAFVSPGQLILDVGINVGEDGKLCGDVKLRNEKTPAAALTPVPGGVGAVTTAVLAKHVVEAAETFHLSSRRF